MVNVNGGYVLSTVALVGASDFNAAHFAAHWKEGAFDAVIAVDGGFASLAAVDCAPDLAMGDFDSLGYVPEGMSVKAFSPEKDASDMELALEEALARGADAVEVYGALGGAARPHGGELAALGLLCRAGGSLWPQWGERERIAFLVGPGELRLPALPSGIVSVFSLTDVSTGVVEEGLKYGLDGVALTNRTSWGLSNELVGTPARIALEAARWQCFCRSSAVPFPILALQP
mgnify:CR=1 FL=1